MALTTPTGTLSVTVKDNNGKTSTLSLQTGTRPAADVVAAISDLAAAVQALTDGVVVAATATFSSIETTPGTPVNTSEVERKLVLVGRTSTGATVRYSVPSAGFTLEQIAGSDSVPLTDANVQALTAFLVGNARSSGDDAITAFTDAFISHRYRRPIR